MNTASELPSNRFSNLNSAEYWIAKVEYWIAKVWLSEPEATAKNPTDSNIEAMLSRLDMSSLRNIANVRIRQAINDIITEQNPGILPVTYCTGCGRSLEGDETCAEADFDESRGVNHDTGEPFETEPERVWVILEQRGFNTSRVIHVNGDEDEAAKRFGDVVSSAVKELKKEHGDEIDDVGKIEISGGQWSFETGDFDNWIMISLTSHEVQ